MTKDTVLHTTGWHHHAADAAQAAGEALSPPLNLHTHKHVRLHTQQVGIITLLTPREVAAEAQVPLSSVPLADERVGAVVVTGSQIREIKTEEEWDDILCKVCL